MPNQKKYRERSPDQTDAAGLSAVRAFSGLGNADKQRIFRSMWRELPLRSGLWLSALQVRSEDGICFDYEKTNECIDFGFILQGSVSNRMVGPVMPKTDVRSSAGDSGMGFFRELEGRICIPGGERSRFIHVHILPELLEELVQDEVENLHPDLRNALENTRHADFLRRMGMSPLVQSTANELFMGLSNNVCSRMYLEGKVLELLGLHLLGGVTPASGQRAALTSGERERIGAVRDYLEKQLGQPPSLAELSRTFNMGISKIQAGFQSLYGMTVFGFLKEYRLQYAKKLFDQGDMNVSEVAWEIGYVNLSHFSAAYRKRFGVLPKTYLRSKLEWDEAAGAHALAGRRH